MAKLLVSLLVSVGALAASGVAMAQQVGEGNWLVRARVLELQPEHKSDAGTGPLAGKPADAITVNDKTIPEVDISYFFTQNIASELVLTVPQKQDVSLAGTGKIGTFKHLPPSLLLQYHFIPDGVFRPYVGAGINYTRISDVSLLNGQGNLERNSWGAAVQAGFDVKVGSQTFINFDVKKIQIAADVMVNGVRGSTVHLDPLLWGVGIGYRF